MSSPYEEILGAIPDEQLQGQIKPLLEKYDSGYQEQLNSLQPFKEFVDNQVQPDFIKTALGVVNAIEENPQMVYDALAQELGLGQNNQNGNQNNNNNNNDSTEGNAAESLFEGLPPEFVEKVNKLEGGYETLAQLMLNQQQESEQEHEDQQLDELYQQLEKSNPTFAALNKDGAAEPYINSLLIAGVSPEDAAKSLEEFVDMVVSNHNKPKAPMVLGGGSSIPASPPVDVGKLNSGETKNLVTQMLREAAQQNE